MNYIYTFFPSLPHMCVQYYIANSRSCNSTEEVTNSLENPIQLICQTLVLNQ